MAPSFFAPYTGGMNQLADTFLMIRPVNFGSNPETAASNPFQSTTTDVIQKLALKEFENYVAQLEGVGIRVLIPEYESDGPDAIFPNNWGSFHADGSIVLYPMLATNRRNERQVLKQLQTEFGLQAAKVIDMSSYEKQNRFLEGTGSIIFDHVFDTAYMSGSARSDKNLFEELCSRLNYDPFYFEASLQGKALYHTNVLLSIGEGFALLCDQAVDDPIRRTELINSLQSTGRQLLLISLEQLSDFCGNILQVKSRVGKPYILMSKRAQKAFTETQLSLLAGHGRILAVDVSNIEKASGGSVRCMVAEVFSPLSEKHS